MFAQPQMEGELMMIRSFADQRAVADRLAV
jgi:hypothetical protein